MAVVLVLTILYQIWLMLHLKPLFKYAPVRLEVESQALLAEYDAKRSTEKSRPQEPTASSKTDFEDGEKGTPLIPEDTPTEMVRDSPILQRTTSSQRPRLSPMASHRPSFLQRPSKTPSHRSQEFQALQKEEVKSANQILARINQPLDEARLAHLENKLEQTETRLGNALFPRRRDIEAQMLDDPISKIIMQHNDELENLAPEERDMLISVAFTHPVLRATRPCVWIPMDDLGISDDEVNRTREFSGDVFIDNRGAYFDTKLRVQVDKPPPDMSEFALIMAEL